jgi:hypothetical protein
MYISKSNSEIEFVLVNVPDREEEVIDELRDAISSGFVGNVFYSSDTVLFVRKLSRRTIGIMNDLHGNIIRTYHVYIVVGVN